MLPSVMAPLSSCSPCWRSEESPRSSRREQELASSKPATDSAISANNCSFSVRVWTIWASFNVRRSTEKSHRWSLFVCLTPFQLLWQWKKQYFCGKRDFITGFFDAFVERTALIKIHFCNFFFITNFVTFEQFNASLLNTSISYKI